MKMEKIHSLKSKAISTTKKMLAIAAYLWVLLSLFALHKALLLDERNIAYQLGFAFVNALALAKVVLVGQELKIGDRFRDNPLIYPIVFKSAIFAALLFCFRVIEETAVGMWHGKTFVQSLTVVDHAVGNGTLPGIIIVCVIMFIALIPFFSYLEVEQAIGSTVMRQMLFGERDEDISIADSGLSPRGQMTSSDAASATTAVWYLDRSGTVVGPVTKDELAKLLRDGDIDEEVLVYDATVDSAWIALGDASLRSVTR